MCLGCELATLSDLSTSVEVNEDIVNHFTSHLDEIGVPPNERKELIVASGDLANFIGLEWNTPH
jgi:hypothetical protein